MHLVEAPFDSRWCHRKFSMIYFFRSHYGSPVDAASKRYKYQEYFPCGKGGRCSGLKTVPFVCLKIWDFWITVVPIFDKYQEYFLGGKGGRCSGLTTVPFVCLKIREPNPPATPRVCAGIALPFVVRIEVANCLFVKSQHCFRDSVRVQNSCPPATKTLGLKSISKVMLK